MTGDRGGDGAVDLPPMLLEVIDRHVGSLVQERDLLHRLGRPRTLYNHDLVGQHHAHARRIDEVRLVGSHGGVLGRGSQVAHRLGVIEPGFGNSVEEGLASFPVRRPVGGGERMVLDVASESRLPNDESRMGRSPVMPELFDGPPFGPLEEGDEFDHGAFLLGGVVTTGPSAGTSEWDEAGVIQSACLLQARPA